MKIYIVNTRTLHFEKNNSTRIFVFVMNSHTSCLSSFHSHSDTKHSFIHQQETEDHVVPIIINISITIQKEIILVISFVKTTRLCTGANVAHKQLLSIDCCDTPTRYDDRYRHAKRMRESERTKKNR